MNKRFRQNIFDILKFKIHNSVEKARFKLHVRMTKAKFNLLWYIFKTYNSCIMIYQ